MEFIPDIFAGAEAVDEVDVERTFAEEEEEEEEGR